MQGVLATTHGKVRVTSDAGAHYRNPPLRFIFYVQPNGFWVLNLQVWYHRTGPLIGQVNGDKFEIDGRTFFKNIIYSDNPFDSLVLGGDFNLDIQKTFYTDNYNILLAHPNWNPDWQVAFLLLPCIRRFDGTDIVGQLTDPALTHFMTAEDALTYLAAIPDDDASEDFGLLPFEPWLIPGEQDGTSAPDWADVTAWAGADEFFEYIAGAVPTVGDYIQELAYPRWTKADKSFDFNGDLFEITTNTLLDTFTKVVGFQAILQGHSTLQFVNTGTVHDGNPLADAATEELADTLTTKKILYFSPQGAPVDNTSVNRFLAAQTKGKVGVQLPDNVDQTAIFFRACAYSVARYKQTTNG